MIFRDFGVAWDELYQDGIGQMNILYLIDRDKSVLLTHPDQDHGPIYEMFLVGLGFITGAYENLELTNQSSLLFRHLVNFCVFFVGVVFFYFLCRKRFKNNWIALLGCVFLVLTPRLFADAFFNSKDTVFLAFFVITTYSLILFLEKRTLLRVAILAILSAIAIDIRIAGIIIPLFVGVFLGKDIIVEYVKSKTVQRNVFLLSVYVVITASGVILFWPFLWSDPYHNFIYVWERSAHYIQDIQNLYLGEYISAKSLPWHYIPVWILITTPPLYIFLFFVGISRLCLLAVKDVRTFILTRDIDILILLWLFFPICMVIIFQSTIYNGWRHLFFIYPAFILIALHGVATTGRVAKYYFHKQYFSMLFIVIVVVNLMFILKILIEYHPYQNLYFNFFAGDMKSAMKKFETDYWGVSYRKGLEYILENDKREIIYIQAETMPGWANSLILPDFERERLSYVWAWELHEKPRPYYYITTFYQSRDDPPHDEVYSIDIQGAKIMGVYKFE